MQPHRGRHWLNGDPDDPEALRRQSAAVCGLYERAGRLAEQGAHVVSTDEKTGVQALQRLHPDIPMGPGRVQAREYEYARHGTVCLTANREAWCGHVVAPALSPARAEAGFAAHVERTAATDPLAGRVFVVDDLDTHQSESLAPYAARACSIAGEPGVKGKAGALKSKASRKALLEGPGRRIRFAYAPRHCSWLNQVGIRFGTPARKLLKRSSFASTEDLKAKVLEFIAYFNRTMAKPVQWLYSPRTTKGPTSSG